LKKPLRNFREESKRAKLMGVKDKLKLQRDFMNQKNISTIDKDLRKYTTHSLDPFHGGKKPINKFRAYIILVQMFMRLKFQAKHSLTQIRLISVRGFVKFYETIDIELRNWLFNCIKIPYQSIINNEGLNVNIAQKNYVPGSQISGDIRERYTKLEVIK